MPTEVRTGRTADAAAVGALLGLPEAAAARLIRTRSVQVAVREDSVIGCLAYDVHDGAVSVTRIDGDPDTFEALLEAPRRLAVAEGFPVEVLVESAESGTANALEALGFSAAGPGPGFDGRSTTRYRWQPISDRR